TSDARHLSPTHTFWEVPHFPPPLLALPPAIRFVNSRPVCRPCRHKKSTSYVPSNSTNEYVPAPAPSPPDTGQGPTVSILPLFLSSRNLKGHYKQHHRLWQKGKPYVPVPNPLSRQGYAPAFLHCPTYPP